MSSVAPDKPLDIEKVEIRLRGTVQGVGFRPTVWRLARDCGLVGEVLNDGAGVLIRAAGSGQALADFMEHLEAQAPPLSRIDALEIRPLAECPDYDDFHIVQSAAGGTHTQVTPDAATCPSCREEVLSPKQRRFRYPFTNCTHCGPRFSIIEGVPYDRSSTTMAGFVMCEDCSDEYGDPSDRRFHAQPIACPRCGPRAWLQRLDGAAASSQPRSAQDACDEVADLLRQGEIVAIRGLGGFHLACDATNEAAVERLRHRKRRYGKPFALMARDLDIIRRYCALGAIERELLESPEAPIVLLTAEGPETLPDAVAPAMHTLGFMLPYTPLHLLILEAMDGPVVMTSGNLSDEPQLTSNEEAGSKLKVIAGHALLHDRDIANRIDDSVIRVMGDEPRLLRRARGYAPSAIALPPGLDDAPDLLAYGGELKSTFCLVKDGAAVLSQHQGDLEEPATFDDYQKNLALYSKLYDHEPALLVADLHPEYLSSKLARDTAASRGLPLREVQHHHAHIASCMAENGVALGSDKVLGVALDGLGYGDDGTFWGGEFLLAGYRGYQRLGTFKPVAMLGGSQAVREPWRNTYAHLMAGIGWDQFSLEFSKLELCDYLGSKPRRTLDQMLETGLNSPLASSCGRLFDAVAAAVGLNRDRALFEGQGAMALEAAIDDRALREQPEANAYRFDIGNLADNGLPFVDPTPMWRGLLDDLAAKTPVPVIAARFHKGLAMIITRMVHQLAKKSASDGGPITAVALSGGCFQNKVLLEEVSKRLSIMGYDVLNQSRVPTNDGGLALGQAVIAAAQHLAR